MNDTNIQLILDAIQDFNTRFDGLETRIDALETRIDALKIYMEKRFDIVDRNIYTTLKFVGKV